MRFGFHNTTCEYACSLFSVDALFHFGRLRLVCQGSFLEKVTFYTRMSCLVCNSSIAAFFVVAVVVPKFG